MTSRQRIIHHGGGAFVHHKQPPQHDSIFGRSSSQRQQGFAARLKVSLMLMPLGISIIAFSAVALFLNTKAHSELLRNNVNTQKLRNFDRPHKKGDHLEAANAALLLESSQSSTKVKENKGGDDVDGSEDTALKLRLAELRLDMKNRHNAMKAELNQLRLEMQIKVKAEQSGLREQVRQQDRIIDALIPVLEASSKNENENNGGDDDTRIRRVGSGDSALKEHFEAPSQKDEGSNQSNKLKTKPEVANSSSHDLNYSLIESRLDQSLYGNREWELTHRNDTDDGRPLPHFFMHIPKTGGYYAYTWLNSMLWQKHSPIYKLPTEDKFRLCNIGSGRLKQRKESHKGKKDLAPIRCNMWMTEREYNEDAANTYTVIRDPREHVLSQYFHCKESKHSKEDRLRRIGSLTDWLEKWVDTLEGGKVDDMNCYDPRNKQSQFTNYGNPARALSPNDALSDIHRRFTVIGPMDEMDKVLCVTFLHYTGWLPPQCDCTSKMTTTAFDEGKEEEDAAASTAARSTIQKKEKTKEAHGVKHHAKTFNASSYQNILIDKLTEKDVMLYEGVKHLFNEQVRVVESRLNVNICNEFNL